jgi:hypothetical protein
MSCMLGKYHQLKPRVWNLGLDNLNTKAERTSNVVVQELESKILHTQTSHFNQTYLKITSRFLFLTGSNSTVISESLEQVLLGSKAWVRGGRSSKYLNRPHSIHFPTRGNWNTGRDIRDSHPLAAEPHGICLSYPCPPTQL